MQTYPEQLGEAFQAESMLQCPQVLQLPKNEQKPLGLHEHVKSEFDNSQFLGS